MSFHRSSLCVACLLLTALHLRAQTLPQPVYDVVSIHENKSDSGNVSVRWGSDAYVANNIPLADLIVSTYNIREELISGLPGWANSFHFDINAKISDPDPDALKKLSREQRQTMMLALLTDRFHLRAHIETKTLPVYDLVISKGGSKLKDNSALPSKNFDSGDKTYNLKPGTFISNASEMTGVAIPVSALAANLAFRVERNIIDKTGLTGKYDIHLKWSPPELEGKPAGLTDNDAPNLFTALQEQLGLKLEPSKGPVDTLVIDHVEMPTDN